MPRAELGINGLKSLGRDCRELSCYLEDSQERGPVSNEEEGVTP